VARKGTEENAHELNQNASPPFPPTPSTSRAKKPSKRPLSRVHPLLLPLLFLLRLPFSSSSAWVPLVGLADSLPPFLPSSPSLPQHGRAPPYLLAVERLQGYGGLFGTLPVSASRKSTRSALGEFSLQLSAYSLSSSRPVSPDLSCLSIDRRSLSLQRRRRRTRRDHHRTSKSSPYLSQRPGSSASKLEEGGKINGRRRNQRNVGRRRAKGMDRRLRRCLV